MTTEMTNPIEQVVEEMRALGEYRIWALGEKGIAEKINAWADRLSSMQAEPVGEYLANVDEYGGVRWTGQRPPHGTKLYATPVEQAEQARDAARRVAESITEFLDQDTMPEFDTLEHWRDTLRDAIAMKTGGSE